MRIASRVAVLAVLAAVAGAAHAQLPFSLPGEPPDPNLYKRPACTADYRRSVEQQIAGMEKLRTAAPEAIGQVCSLIEWGSDWLGGELSESTRKQLKNALGFDVDLRFMRAQCRAGQGNLDRELMTRIGYLKAELVRCNDTI